ncbi:hypothetical protein BS78_10G149200 [Paspalum vaginatum]|nr:hypothetical protein BS78_10G149200 [Paspalum vaginatum]
MSSGRCGWTSADRDRFQRPQRSDSHARRSPLYPVPHPLVRPASRGDASSPTPQRAPPCLRTYPVAAASSQMPPSTDHPLRGLSFSPLVTLLAPSTDRHRAALCPELPSQNARRPACVPLPPRLRILGLLTAPAITALSATPMIPSPARVSEHAPARDVAPIEPR